MQIMQYLVQVKFKWEKSDREYNQRKKILNGLKEERKFLNGLKERKKIPERFKRKKENSWTV